MANNTNGIEYISTQRKGNTLVYKNYYYRVDKTVSNKTYWKCFENCGARVTIIDRNTVYSESSVGHNHSPRPVKIEEKRFKAKLRLKSKMCPLEPIPKVNIKN